MKLLTDTQLNILCMLGLAGIALGRVLVTNSIGCPELMDCNSYIRMVSDLTPGTDLAGHHGMRIFPVLLVRVLMWFGLSLETSFHVISGSSYALFGAMSYWFIYQITRHHRYAISWALLLLSLHHAIRIPLYLVYQANDALVYPIGLGILIATYHKKLPFVLLLSLIGIFTRQNMFVLSFLSLLYLFKQDRGLKPALTLCGITVLYMLLQSYYGAHGVFQSLLSPPDSFFSISRIGQILIESQFLELWLVLVPFMLFGIREVLTFFQKHWHWFLYAGITAFQPLVGYHLTGNNLPRLALQGVFVVGLALSLSSPVARWSSRQQWLLLVYAIAIYSTWGIEERLIICGTYVLACLLLARAESKSLTSADEQA